MNMASSYRNYNLDPPQGSFTFYACDRKMGFTYVMQMSFRAKTHENSFFYAEQNSGTPGGTASIHLSQKKLQTWITPSNSWVVVDHALRSLECHIFDQNYGLESSLAKVSGYQRKPLVVFIGICACYQCPGNAFNLWLNADLSVATHQDLENSLTNVIKKIYLFFDFLT